MSKRLPVPPSLQHLIEKREAGDRRKKSALGDKPKLERRSARPRRSKD